MYVVTASTHLIFFQMCHWWSLARYHVRCNIRKGLWPIGYWIECYNRRETSCLARLWVFLNIPLFCLFYLPLLIHYAQLICGCHHGQFWLSNKGFFHLGISPFGRIYHYLVRIWSWWKVNQMSTFFRYFCLYPISWSRGIHFYLHRCLGIWANIFILFLQFSRIKQ